MRIEEFAQRFFQNALPEGMWRYHGTKGMVEPLTEAPMPGSSPVITLEILRGQASNQLQARSWFHQQQLWQDHASFRCEAHPPTIREALGELSHQVSQQLPEDVWMRREFKFDVLELQQAFAPWQKL